MSVPSHIVLRTGSSNWRDYVPLLTVDFTSNIQSSWSPNSQYNDVNVDPSNEIAKQFSYFAAYWLNRNNADALNVSVYPTGGTFYFQATTVNPVTSYQGLYEAVNGSYITLTPQQDGIQDGIRDGIEAGRVSSSYASIPSGPRTLLHYISSFGITGSSSNNGSTSWNSGYDTLTLTHINTYDNYFSRSARVRIIQGDGSSTDGPDWVIFNFDVDNGGSDFHGNHTNYSYFGGESSSGSTSNGGSGGLYITHGFIWGWANDKWNKLFQMELPGNGGLFSNSFAGWWASGNTVTSGNGKYYDYDTLPISHVGFSVQYTFSTLETLAPLALKVTPELGEFGMTKTFGDSPFTITQPSSASSGAFTYSVSSGTGVISMSGTIITILSAGTATVTASQAASGNYNATTKDATIQINQLAATLSASPNIFYRKFVSGASISFDVITSNAGTVARTHESSNSSIFSIPTASVPSGTIVAPGKITINVIQPATTNYTAITTNQLITIIIVGSGITYTSETFPASFDLAGTNLTGSTFNSCNLTSANLTNANLTNSVFSGSTDLTSANLFGATVNSSTSFTTSTLTRITSGRITGVTSLLPAGFTMI